MTCEAKLDARVIALHVTCEAHKSLVTCERKSKEQRAHVRPRGKRKECDKCGQVHDMFGEAQANAEAYVKYVVSHVLQSCPQDMQVVA